MTVSSTTRKQTFAGGTATLTFSFRALTSAPTDIKVTKTLISSGVDTALTYTSEYTVAISADGVGGVVTISPTISTLYNLVVYRETTNKQESDYDDYNQFPANTLETDLDRRAMIEQELAESMDRTLKLPISNTLTGLVLPNPSAGKALKWSGTGSTIVNSTVDIEDIDSAVASALASQLAASTSATLAMNAATTSTTAATTATNSLLFAINAQTVNYTLALTDVNKLIDMNSAGTITLTIPSSGTVNIPTGSVIGVRQLGAGQVVISTAANVTLRKEVGAKLTGQYAIASLLKTGSDEWLAFGALEA